MTDPKTPAYFAPESGGMRTNGGCRCFKNAGFPRSPTAAAFKLLPALRCALKERDEARHTADTLRAKLEIAREGLRKYAAEESYSSYQPLSCGCCSVDKEPEVMLDRGGTARATLAKLEEKS